MSIEKGEVTRGLDEGYMRTTKQLAGHSRCKKKELLCTLVLSDGNCLFGSNGPPMGLLSCSKCKKTIDGIEGNHQCRAIHAERSVLLQAAMLGFSTKDSTLYAYMGVPCKDCMLELIAAGVKRIVTNSGIYYDRLSRDIMKEWLSVGGKWDICKIDKHKPHKGVDE